MMDKWNLIVDVAKCVNCNNCVLSAKDEFVGNDFPGYTAPHPKEGPGVIRIERKVRGAGHLVDAAFMVRTCNHCDEGPCLKAGADGSVRKRDDGIVIFDPVKAKGRRDLVDSCPYGAVVWNEELQLPQTWFFDAHLLDQGWSAPRGVTVCPTEALEAVRVADATMAERAQREGLRVLQPELATKPRVYYRNLHRYDSCFVAGSVTALIGGRVECVADADVRLLQRGQVVASTSTDAFGDFRFDGLSAGMGECRVRAMHREFGMAERALTVAAETVVLGEIGLE